MSDAVLIEIVGGFITIGTLITTAIINSIQNKRIARESKKIAQNVAEYHKEVNGKMGILLETTKELGKAEEKAEETQRQIDKP